MTFKKIKEQIRSGKFLFSDHADGERTKDDLSVGDIKRAILSGQVIEKRLNDPRGESRLIAGLDKQNKVIHIVIGIRFGFPVIVTVYRPSKNEWISGKIRKR